MKFKHIFLLGILFGLISCSDDNKIDYKQKMRDLVIEISHTARQTNTNFIIIPQNGIELVTKGGETNGIPALNYLSAIDGHGQEDLFYGYDIDNVATPSSITQYLTTFLDISKNYGNSILVTDYCSSTSNVSSSYIQNNSNDYISFAADQRELYSIPSYPAPIYEENSNNITQLSQAKNFLYLINPDNYSTKTAFISAVTNTNYDLLIMDLFFHDGTWFTANEITQLKVKANGGSRLIICYMSIGEAENYRYYWKDTWSGWLSKPSFIDKENPDWEGNYKVKYWYQEWKDILFGKEASYLTKILNAGFDGVYLDIIDAFEYYED